MDLLTSFKSYIKKNHLFQQRDRLLIAVSGGADSVVLCELCRQAGYDFSIAHCNFQLRDKESDADEIFVKDLGRKYEVEIFVKKFDVKKYEEENKVSIQVAARELRYHWFRELVNQSPALPFNYILTAHHADDNIETVLMNFFKGTGIQGLQGILPKDPGIGKCFVRPLLFARKKDILLYAQENKLHWREDASNSSNVYTRNYFRNELIPSLQKIYPRVAENLLADIERFRDIHFLYQQSINTIKKKLLEVKGHDIHIPVLKLKKNEAKSTIIYELTKDYGFSPGQVTGILKLLESDSGKFIISPTHRILRNRNWLIISPLKEGESGYFLLHENEPVIIMADGKLELSRSGTPTVTADPNLAQLDAALVQFPLLVRKWKQGDYFYPLGMKKKKKLSRFFIDQKLSLNEKQDIWVIESNKKILWVVGKRIDDRFKISEKTISSVNILWRPSK